MLRAKASTQPLRMPVRASGNRIDQNASSGSTQRAGGLEQAIVDRRESQTDRADQQGKCSDGRRQRRPFPIKDQPNVKHVFEKGAQQAVPAEKHQQQITRDHGRQHQREIDQRFNEEFAGEVTLRQ
jgi:hypothetical protein